MNLRGHVEALAQGLEERLQLVCVGDGRRRLEVHPHEEQAGAVFVAHVAVLLRLEDVAAVVEQGARNRVDDALRVRAGQGQNEFVAASHVDLG